MTADPRSLPDPFPITLLETPPDAEVVLPGSKSITNRALVCAALADGRSTLSGALFADDTVAMLGVLEALGVRTEADSAAATIMVDGCGGAIPGIEAEVSANQSGTTARFAVPLVATGAAPVVMLIRMRASDGSVRGARAMGVSIEELGEPGRLLLGLWSDGPTRPRCRDVSSQFITGLFCRWGRSPARNSTEPPSPYIDMTVAVMAAFGAAIEHDGQRRVGWGGYRGTDYLIEPDASAASYALAAAAIPEAGSA